jgi:hypothetical protein
MQISVVPRNLIFPSQAAGERQVPLLEMYPQLPVGSPDYFTGRDVVRERSSRTSKCAFVPAR